MNRAWIALVALALAGCASSPPSRFYTLSGPASPSAPSGNLSIAVGPVAIPAVVDRPQIVVSVGQNEVWLDELNRWASPLADAIAIAAVENLSAALDTRRATSMAQGGSDVPDYRASVEVQRFESVPGSHALLDAVYTVRRTADGRSVSGRTTARETTADKSYEALAAAHSRAVAALSRDIAGATRAVAAQALRPGSANRSLQ